MIPNSRTRDRTKIGKMNNTENYKLNSIHLSNNTKFSSEKQVTQMQALIG